MVLRRSRLHSLFHYCHVFALPPRLLTHQHRTIFHCCVSWILPNVCCVFCLRQTSLDTFQSLAFRTNAKSSVRTISVCRWDHMIDISWIHTSITRRHPAPLLHLSFFFPIHPFAVICYTPKDLPHDACSLVLLAEEREERGKKRAINNMMLTSCSHNFFLFMCWTIIRMLFIAITTATTVATTRRRRFRCYPCPTRRPACHHLNWTYCWHCHYQLIIIIIIIVIHTFSTISSLMLLILITSLVALAWESILM